MILFNTLTNHSMFAKFEEAGIIVGFAMIVLAIVIVGIIDHWKIKDKERELEEIDAYAQEIAERKIYDALQNFDKED